MCSSFLHRRRRGVLLLEVMLGIGVLAVFLSGIGLNMLLGQEQTIMGGDRIHAIHRSQSALEAARSVRDTSFDSLVPDGESRGVGIEGGVWALVSSPVTDAQGFETSLTITEVSDHHVLLQAETRWKRGYNRSGSVILSTELTDWRASLVLGDWNTVGVQGSGSIAGVTPLFTAAVVRGDFLYATGEDIGGDELYVINLSSLSDPHLGTSIDLGASGLNMVIRGERLYILTDDTDAELKIYSIVDPVAPVYVTALNLQRDARGRAMAFYGDRLLVGAVQDAEDGFKEVYLYDVSDPDALTFIPDGGLDIDADVMAIAVSGTSALLAISDVGAEFRCVDARDPPLFALPPSEGYNPAGAVSVQSIATANRVAVLGRSGLYGLTRFDLSAQGFVSPATPPLLHDVGGTVNGLAIDPTACIAFAAVGNSVGGTDMQVVRLGGVSLTSLGEFHRDADNGRVIVYDSDRDRVYLLTDTAWYVLRPGPGSLTCP